LSDNAFMVETGTGAYDIRAEARWIGKDLLVAVWGGELPHIGAVAVAQPRPSLRDPNVVSSTASVICLPAHKEYEIARTVAERLAAALNTSVVVTAGIHWDNISQTGIERVVENSKILMDLILEQAVAGRPRFAEKSN
jgi:gallate decarboxylase subunit D